MAAVRGKATMNDASSRIVPDQPPSGVKPCSLMKPLRLGVFFDGTGNNKYKDEGTGHETNVVKLLNIYLDKSDAEIDRDKLYLIGVGAGGPPTQRTVKRVGRGVSVTETPVGRWSELQSTEGTWVITGGAFGYGMKDRINIAYKWVLERVKQHTDDSVKLIDVYGFSRGAAAARTFNNLIVQAFPREEHARNSFVRFLGIFDTVASTGKPGAGWYHAVGLNLGLDTQDFKGCRHFTARDEVRANFPLSVLNANDHEFAGVHSDVGGSYGKGTEGDEKKSNWLGGPTLWYMYRGSQDQGVEFTGLPKMPDVYREAGSKDVTTKVLPPDEKDVAAFHADGDKFDGSGAERSNTWRDRFVHDSTMDYAPLQKLYKGNWANNVDDTSKGPIGYDPESGMPIYPQMRKRERLTEERFKLKAMPPSYSWK